MTALQRYKDFRPTAMDCRGLGLPDQQDWFVAPCYITRDSRVFDQANWVAQQQILEGHTYEIHRFGHWGPGWFEIVLVEPTDAAAVLLEEIQGALADYPLLSEDLHSEMELEAVLELWDRTSLRDRIYDMTRLGLSIFAARRDTPPERWQDHASGEV